MKNTMIGCLALLASGTLVATSIVSAGTPTKVTRPGSVNFENKVVGLKTGELCETGRECCAAKAMPDGTFVCTYCIDPDKESCAYGSGGIKGPGTTGLETMPR